MVRQQRRKMVAVMLPTCTVQYSTVQYSTVQYSVMLPTTRLSLVWLLVLGAGMVVTLRGVIGGHQTI